MFVVGKKGYRVKLSFGACWLALLSVSTHCISIEPELSGGVIDNNCET